MHNGEPHRSVSGVNKRISVFTPADFFHSPEHEVHDDQRK